MSNCKEVWAIVGTESTDLEPVPTQRINNPMARAVIMYNFFIPVFKI
ncbi:MAG: hypothetical protein BWY69_00951 [Planctomycetes bacterium ADurb.Bin401]|nr:MAG: hypothetical protein BWY69_00951 [Planctomycetes bacterium ADurb.Bin401]